MSSEYKENRYAFFKKKNINNNFFCILLKIYLYNIYNIYIYLSYIALNISFYMIKIKRPSLD